ncbi:type I-E CRISPR-associated protein Cas5/CasD [Paracoccus spongiarum]|uniref:Type I-E CRISPR-associated protein Cas5/CasD n=1 Tax=Paracoccus spongiarum TaxID=3064387 RepID=A0ABT9JB95_9RHOB|nr:type I-E CRISPR-associated protein Cas5/CasD [Paracoccus sp. 2205BS29-5]MDP5306422.1 type I-E CRISPR-associated protein Cas5/CasD [Paracoccus sp. 2205BS29-5]
MRDHLIFTLAATLGSMGELAGHARRGSWSWPGRSSVLGLCAAAMGIRRENDFSALDRLGMAVAIFAEGDPLRDYHTVQSVPSAAARRPQSRGEALRLARQSVRLGKGGAETSITLRDYRVGTLYGVALWGNGLAVLREALLRPAFTLYLGRKSCPLSVPLAPKIVAASDAATALTRLSLPPWQRGARAHAIATEEDLPGGRVETRQDRPIDRIAWHFAPRTVKILPCEIAPGVAGEAAA